MTRSTAPRVMASPTKLVVGPTATTSYPGSGVPGCGRGGRRDSASGPGPPPARPLMAPAWALRGTTCTAGRGCVPVRRCYTSHTGAWPDEDRLLPLQRIMQAPLLCATCATASIRMAPSASQGPLVPLSPGPRSLPLSYSSAWAPTRAPHDVPVHTSYEQLAPVKVTCCIHFYVVL